MPFELFAPEMMAVYCPDGSEATIAASRLSLGARPVCRICCSCVLRHESFAAMTWPSSREFLTKRRLSCALRHASSRLPAFLFPLRRGRSYPGLFKNKESSRCDFTHSIRRVGDT
jgi:hypothetical protein